MAITPVPPLDRTSATFRSDVDVFFGSRISNFVSEVNALAANLNSIAAGGAYAIPYTWSSYGDLSGPAGGRAGINASLTHQNDTQYLYLDLKSQVGRDESVALSSFTESSSAVRGTLRLEKVGDPTKWIRYNIIGSSVLVTTSLIAIRVAGVNSSSADPFAPGDAVVMYFQRTGDKGDQGPAGTTGYQVLASYAVGSPVSAAFFATVFTGDYDRYVIAVDGLALSAQAGINMRLAVAGMYDSSAKYSPPDGQSFTATAANVSGGYAVPAAKSFNARIEIWNANSAGMKSIRGECAFANAAGGLQAGLSQVGYVGANAVSGFFLYPDTGNFTGGTVRVYGIKNTL